MAPMNMNQEWRKGVGRFGAYASLVTGGVFTVIAVSQFVFFYAASWEITVGKSTKQRNGSAVRNSSTPNSTNAIDPLKTQVGAGEIDEPSTEKSQVGVKWPPRGFYWLAAGIMAGAIGILFVIFSPEPPSSFIWALGGIGYALFLDAVATMTALIGFAYSDTLSQVLCASNASHGSDRDPGVLAARLALAVAMALLGALFFIANRLRIAQSTNEQFDSGKFWSGIWFRLGQATLYTAAVYLMIAVGLLKVQETYVVVLALFIGMFVKAAERTFYGIGQRLLAMVDAMIPLPEDKAARNASSGKKDTAPATAPATATATATGGRQ